ncbi:MAG: RNA-binding protein [bacterium]|nr:RNA-binding protein [bacterium]
MKIYVGNLPFSSSENDVRDLFAEHGQVSDVAIIMDRDTGRPRGFGFVEMPSDSEASEAINKLNGYDLGGRQLNVNEAKPREDRGGGGGRGGYGGGRGGGGGYGGGRGGGGRY